MVHSIWSVAAPSSNLDKAQGQSRAAEGNLWSSACCRPATALVGDRVILTAISTPASMPIAFNGLVGYLWAGERAVQLGRDVTVARIGMRRLGCRCTDTDGKDRNVTSRDHAIQCEPEPDRTQSDAYGYMAAPMR